MKGIDIFCASQAATAIRLGHMDDENDPSLLSSSSATIQLAGGSISGRAIDRHNPIIKDPRRLGRTIPHPIIPSSCSSQSQQEVISPVPLLQSHHNDQNIKKNSPLKKPLSEPRKEKPENDTQNKKKKKKKIISRRSVDISKPLSPIDIEDKKKGYGGDSGYDDNLISRNDLMASISTPRRRSCTFTSTVSPVGSTRYLLSNDQNQNTIFNVISDFDPVLKLEVEEDHPKSNPPASPAPAQPKPEPTTIDVKSSSTTQPSSDQVVVLRVSLHCRGCERKMRKHISRMEGAHNFSCFFLCHISSIFYQQGFVSFF
ncbi:OLC1v1034744C1 [Oldenlandia corymbosa var. corymbosa]|uniref:OLC1v1034744C1 n=1 Tax=Oldenlandia corymbosa var. corymbosa TaxID=529605 RepID=A0AAV1CRY7_OLDCO|nr:OLC1v1034744C1 [Oldenlandia corymbosa var. corymbosa]